MIVIPFFLNEQVSRLIQLSQLKEIKDNATVITQQIVNCSTECGFIFNENYANLDKLTLMLSKVKKYNFKGITLHDER